MAANWPMLSALHLLPRTPPAARFGSKDSGGLDLVLSVRTIPPHKGLDLVAPGTRAVSVFLVNNRDSMTGIRRDEAYVFQVKLQLESDLPFVARPDLRGVISSDPDERVADLQYRDAFEYAVGHGVSARALPVKTGGCRSVETAWIPQCEVERIEHRAPRERNARNGQTGSRQGRSRSQIPD